MITLIEALNYRCLRYVHQPLDRFHVLVGPNGSGKTTFLDALAFVSRLVSDGLDAAVEERAPRLDELLFRHGGDQFQLAIEARIPPSIHAGLALEPDRTIVRYEVAVGRKSDSDEVVILSESVKLCLQCNEEFEPHALFPSPCTPPGTIVESRQRRGRTIIRKGENDRYSAEIYPNPPTTWAVTFKLGPRRSALGNLPEDETKFPVSTWLKETLRAAVQTISLDSHAMRRASPPGQQHQFRTDGANLPWVLRDFERSHPTEFRDWISHLQTALPDLTGIRTVERQDDRHRYLVLKYMQGFEVPSWVASDGTLRLLALTLLAYLPRLEGIFLVEEPENGIHPRAVETMFQSLANVYDAQVLLATHSPVILSVAEPEQVLCFAKDESGATDIVRGDQHPALVDWQRDTNLGVLFAAGVLG